MTYTCIREKPKGTGGRQKELALSLMMWSFFAGSGLLGYAMGFALKKIVGFLAGMFFVGVQLLQKYGYVSAVNWDYLP
jgi:uncharacterized membrane protein (Fun14 family)